MHIETINFDRVFDLQQREASRYAPRRTDFSFEAGGKKHFAVQVSGWPRISPGDKVVVVLGRAGNWQTLAGWKNLTTGEVVVPNAQLSLGGVWHSAVVGAIFLASFSTASSEVGRVASGAAAALCFCVSLSLLAQWRRKRVQAATIQNAG